MNSIRHIIWSIETEKQSGNYDAALSLALEWLKTHIDDYRLYEELADIYVYQNNLDKAEEVIRYARELHPESGTGMFLEGYILAEKGDFDAAIKILEESNKIFPNNPEVLRNLWWSHVMHGNLPKGINILRRAHALAPDDAKIFQNLSHALLVSDTIWL